MLPEASHSVHGETTKRADRFPTQHDGERADEESLRKRSVSVMTVILAVEIDRIRLQEGMDLAMHSTDASKLSTGNPGLACKNCK
jgi:hypothetical protein